MSGHAEDDGAELGPQDHDPTVEADVDAEPEQRAEAEVEAQEVAAERAEAEAVEQLDDTPEEPAEEAPADATADDEGADDEEAADEEAADEPAPELLHGVPVTRPRGEVVLHPAPEQYVELVSTLREEGYWTAVDLFGVDQLGNDADRGLPPGTTAERFEVVVVLRNHTDRSMARIRLQVPGDDPVVPSLFALHPGLENPEREAFDMFGIDFDGHPGLSRILMPDDWDGHPLRKDFAVGRIPVQFKGVSSTR